MGPRALCFDVGLAAALAVVTVLSRLPYRARMLDNWDAVALNNVGAIAHVSRR